MKNYHVHCISCIDLCRGLRLHRRLRRLTLRFRLTLRLTLRLLRLRSLSLSSKLLRRICRFFVKPQFTFLKHFRKLQSDTVRNFRELNIENHAICEIPHSSTTRKIRLRTKRKRQIWRKAPRFRLECLYLGSSEFHNRSATHA